MSFVILVSLLACQGSAQEDDFKLDGTTFLSRNHDLTLSVPKDWGTLRVGTDKKLTGKNMLVEGESTDSTCRFFVGFEPLGLPTEKYISAWEKAQEKNHLKKTAHGSLLGRGREFVRCEYEQPKGKEVLDYSVVFTTRGKNTYRLVLWWARSEEAKHRYPVEVIVRSFRPAPPDPASLQPNPWTGFGVGSWAEYRQEIDLAELGKKVVFTRQVLTDAGDGTYYEYRVDIQKGTSFSPGETTRVDLLKKPGDTPKIETGEETIEVPAGKFACRWTKSTFPDGMTKSWTHESVPGGLVRMEGDRLGIKSQFGLTLFEKK